MNCAERESQGDKRQGLLYEIRRGKRSGYLFGTIHYGMPDFYPLNGAALCALFESKILAIEADYSDQVAAMGALREFGTYTYPDSLIDHLPPEVMDKVLELMGAHDIGRQAVVAMKPWLAQEFLIAGVLEDAGYKKEFGVEKTLQWLASARRMRSVGLETIRELTERRASASPSYQEEALRLVLSRIDSGQFLSSVQRLASAWALADRDAIEAYWYEEEASFTETDSDLKKRLLTLRNPILAQRIDDLLKSGACHFVAVGVLHLIGSDGIVERLRKMGYQVSDVYGRNKIVPLHRAASKSIAVREIAP